MLNILHTPDSDGLDHLLYPDADDGWLALFECRHDYQGYYGGEGGKPTYGNVPHEHEGENFYEGGPGGSTYSDLLHERLAVSYTHLTLPTICSV